MYVYKNKAYQSWRDYGGNAKWQNLNNKNNHKDEMLCLDESGIFRAKPFTQFVSHPVMSYIERTKHVKGYLLICLD
jgi:hypothetical protein